MLYENSVTIQVSQNEMCKMYNMSSLCLFFTLSDLSQKIQRNVFATVKLPFYSVCVALWHNILRLPS